MSERLIDFLWIEANNHLTPDQSDRSSHGAKPSEFSQGRSVLGHIAIGELYALLRKILLRLLAEHSAGLRKYDYWRAHIF